LSDVILTSFVEVNSRNLSGSHVCWGSYDGFNFAGWLCAERMSCEYVVDSNDVEEYGGIPGIINRRLQFLGLLNCAYRACERPNLPAVQVTVTLKLH